MSNTILEDFTPDQIARVKAANEGGSRKMFLKTAISAAFYFTLVAIFGPLSVQFFVGFYTIMLTLNCLAWFLFNYLAKKIDKAETDARLKARMDETIAHAKANDPTFVAP